MPSMFPNHLAHDNDTVARSFSVADVRVTRAGRIGVKMIAIQAKIYSVKKIRKFIYCECLTLTK